MRSEYAHNFDETHKLIAHSARVCQTCFPSLPPTLFSYACASSLVAMFLILKFLVENNLKYSIAYSAAPSACCCIPFACTQPLLLLLLFHFPLFTFHFASRFSGALSTFFFTLYRRCCCFSYCCCWGQTNNSGRIRVRMRIQIPQTTGYRYRYS